MNTLVLVGANWFDSNLKAKQEIQLHSILLNSQRFHKTNAIQFKIVPTLKATLKLLKV